MGSCEGEDAMANIPIIDVSEGDEEVAKKLVEAFETLGFAFVSGHGISENQLETFHAAMRQFYELDDGLKLRYARENVMKPGWVAYRSEIANKERAYDPKEAYNMMADNERRNWPSEVAEFKVQSIKMFDSCVKLSQRVLGLLAVGLGRDENEFLDKHHFVDEEVNMSTLRSLYYGSAEKTEKCRFQVGHIRCGEHTDLGCLTILFQDNCGGLQIMNKDGVYRDVPMLPGAALLNIGDIMAFWTDGRLQSTQHRVVETQMATEGRIRQSLAFFAHPDHDEPIAGFSGQQPPITNRVFVTDKLTALYADG